MRKVKLFVVMLVMLSVLSLMFSATVNAQSTNYDPKLVGTWVNVIGNAGGIGHILQKT